MNRVPMHATLVASHAKTVRDYLTAGALVFEAFRVAAEKLAQISKGVTP